MVSAIERVERFEPVARRTGAFLGCAAFFLITLVAAFLGFASLTVVVTDLVLQEHKIATS